MEIFDQVSCSFDFLFFNGELIDISNYDLPKH